MERDRLEIAQLLSDASADANAQSQALREETALQAAASAGDLEITDLLLSWGAIDSALRGGHMQAAQALLSFGAGLDAIDNGAYKVMALKVGIRFRDHHFVRSVLESGVDLDACTNSRRQLRATALQEAVMEDDLDLVRLLISFGADVDAAADSDYGEKALDTAARGGHIELVQLLLDAGADVNSGSSRLGMMALEGAVYGGEIEIVQLLLDSGADICVQGAAAVMETIRIPRNQGDYADIRQLLFDRFPSSGVHSFDGRYEPYRDFTIDYEVMLLLVQHGVVDDGFALRYAVMQGDLGLVKLALHLGADVNAGQQEFEVGCWILGGAMRNGCELKIIQLLLEHGANAHEIARALQNGSIPR